MKCYQPQAGQNLRTDFNNNNFFVLTLVLFTEKFQIEGRQKSTGCLE